MSPAPLTKAHCEITCKTEKDFWDHVKTGAEIIGIVLLAVYTGYTIKMYCANKKAADAAKSAADTAASQLELDDRPWVDAAIALDDLEQFPLEYNVNGANIHLKVKVRNSGHSPAQNVDISSSTALGKTSIDATKQLQDACKSASLASTRFASVGTIFPTVIAERRESIGFGKEDIQKSQLASNSMTFPTVIICIAYQPIFKKQVIYHTAYIVDLYTVDDKGHLGVTFNLGTNLDSKHITLIAHTDHPVVAD